MASRMSRCASMRPALISAGNIFETPRRPMTGEASMRPALISAGNGALATTAVVNAPGFNEAGTDQCRKCEMHRRH